MAEIEAAAQQIGEGAGRIESSKQQAEEVLTSLQALGIRAAANALSAGKDQLEECLAQAIALQNKLEEAKAAVEASKHA
ncbi:hypothetical protein [Glycomyces salinus]|uniref:hypothetical protein n=1 Tax=Glycomyces salinus TaxID=980294 RepID=UPI0018EDCB12|nr:hypothetical protein [Glycomyces salinus]